MDHSALAVQIPGAPGLSVPAAREVRSELIIADGTCLGLAPLLAEAMLPLLRIGGEADPLAAITAELDQQRRSGHLPAVLHLVGHGEPGALHLGRSRIDRQALVNAAPLLASWGTSQIVLWSCEVGADSAFISTLAELTGAQVLATASQVGVGHQLSFLDAGGLSLQLEELFPESAIERWGGTLANVYDAGGKEFNFIFTNAELLTPGNSLSINAKYRYRNVVTVKDSNGNDVSIDAIVSVVDLWRAIIVNIDSSQFQYNVTQFPIANSLLQTIVRFDGTTDPSAVKGGYADLNIDFVENFNPSTGHGDLVSLSNLNVDIYDIDGTGATKSARQYVEADKLDAAVVSVGTLIDISSTQDGRVRFSANNTPVAEGDPAFMAPGYNITGLPGTIVTTPGDEQGYATGDLIRAQLLYSEVSSLRFRLGESAWAESTPYGAFFSLNFGSSVPFDNTQTIVFSSLGDRVWADTNVNGQQDVGEAGVAGVVVELFASIDGQPNGTALATTFTDSDGNYSFQNLLPGNYIVKFTAPEGAYFTLANQGDDASDSDATTSGFTASYTLAPGESNNTVDAGLFTLSSIAGNVYHDANNDGVFDSTEAGIGGVALTLTGVDAFGNAVSLSTTTAANGSYQFADLVPGTYSVTQTQPSGWVDGKDSLGSAGGVLANDLLSGINLLSGVDASNYNFGEALFSSLGDRVWRDTNVNGQQDDGEAGVAGVVVELFASVDGQPSGTVLATTSTDSDGNYIFNQLQPGDYIVKFTAPEGARFTLANQGDDASDSDADASGCTASYTLAPGESINTADAGLFNLSSIAGNVYHDLNNDGVFDSTEAGIGGVALTLTGVDAFGNAVSLSTTTAANGSYQFADLVPGTYSVTQTQPSGWVDGKDSLGSAGGVLANDLLSGINLLSGVDASNYNFGEALPTPPPQDPIVAPGVRTPGFWGSCTWSKFWDGVAGNEPKQARTKGFPVGDLQFAPYKSGAQGSQRDPVTGTNRAGLLIGDWNRNGITDAGEQTIFYSTNEALKIINASVKPNTGDTRYILGRSLNAAWLNYVAGNPVDTAAVGDRDARHWINAGIQWLGTHTPDENRDRIGDGSLTSLASPAIRASSSAWSTPITGGNAIHTSLDRYNNGQGGLADGLFSGG